MEYVFYVDVFFLTDFFLNLLSLFLTAAFLRKPIRIFRICLAAAVGSVWNCVLILRPMASAGAELLVTVLGVGSLMAVVSFVPPIEPRTEAKEDARKRRWKETSAAMRWGNASADLQERMRGKLSSDSQARMRARLSADLRVRLGELILADAALCISTFLLAGCLSFAREQFFLSDGECLVFTGLLTSAVGVFMQYLLESEEIGTMRFLVRLYYRGESREFTALADSGNRLCVPETGKPVSLISYHDCKGFCDRISGGFFIPYRAVGTDHGLLFAITFEKMEIRKNGMSITIENPAVAIVNESLSSNGDFNMLLPEEYVRGISDRRKSA